MADAKSPVKAKSRLPFKATALRRISTDAAVTPDKTEDDDSLRLFDRRNEVLPRIAAEQERRIKKKEKEGKRKPGEGKLARVRPDDDVKRSGGDLESASLSGLGDPFPDISPPPSKRSRTDYSLPPQRAPSPSGTSSGAPSGNPVETVVAVPSTAARSPAWDDLDDPFEVVEVRPATVEIRDDSPDIVEITPANVGGDDEQADDDPFANEEEAAWMQKYIDRAKEEKAQTEASRSRSAAPESQDTPFAADPAPTPDWEVWIYITSPIPGAWQGVVVKRRVSQTLGLVLEAWERTQRMRNIPLPEGEGSNLILTWREKRLYSISTVLSLGISAAPDGALRAASGGGGEGFHDGWRQLHFQVWTEALYAEHLARRAREKRAEEDGAEAEGESGGEDGEADAPEPPEPERKVRVMLKARDGETEKTRVRLSTTVRMLADFYRHQKGLDPGVQVVLRFDGEQLQEHMTVAEVDIDDMDTIDVIVR